MSDPTTGATLRQDSNLSPREFGELWGIHPETVRRLIERGELTAVDVSAGRREKPRWRITPEAAAAWQARRATRQPAPRTRARRNLPIVKQFI